jgi:hypothetical protein
MTSTSVPISNKSKSLLSTRSPLAIVRMMAIELNNPNEEEEEDTTSTDTNRNVNCLCCNDLQDHKDGPCMIEVMKYCYCYAKFDTPESFEKHALSCSLYQSLCTDNYQLERIHTCPQCTNVKWCQRWEIYRGGCRVRCWSWGSGGCDDCSSKK